MPFEGGPFKRAPCKNENEAGDFARPTFPTNFNAEKVSPNFPRGRLTWRKPNRKCTKLFGGGEDGTERPPKFRGTRSPRRGGPVRIFAGPPKKFTRVRWTPCVRALPRARRSPGGFPPSPAPHRAGAAFRRQWRDRRSRTWAVHVDARGAGLLLRGKKGPGMREFAGVDLGEGEFAGGQREPAVCREFH